MTSVRKSAAVVTVMVCLVSQAAWAGVRRPDVFDQFHLDLANIAPFDSVGLVDVGDAVGSGTLLNAGPGYVVLTAGHVVWADGTGGPKDPSEISVTLGGQTYNATGVVVHPNYDGDNPGTFTEGFADDLALISLDAVVDQGITRANLAQGDITSEDLLTLIVTTVGYGTTGTADTTDRTNDGLKRAGHNVIDRLVNNGNNFEVDFDNPNDPGDSWFGSVQPLPEDYHAGKPFPVPPPGATYPNRWEEYMIFTGDSGGGAFVQLNNKWLLAGVNDYGISGPSVNQTGDGQIDSDYGDIAGHVSVPTHAQWITDTITAEISGQLPIPEFTEPIGDPPYPWFQGTVGGLASGWGPDLNIGWADLDAGTLPTDAGPPDVGLTEEVVPLLATLGFDTSSTAKWDVERNFFKNYYDLWMQKDDTGQFHFALVDYLSDLFHPTVTGGTIDETLSNTLDYEYAADQTLVAGNLLVVDFDHHGDEDEQFTMYFVVDQATGDTIFADLIQQDELFSYGLYRNADGQLTWAAGFSHVLPIPLASGTIRTPGDFDLDGAVGQADLDMLLANWGSTDIPEGWVGPFDGTIDQNELTMLLANWGAVSPSPLNGSSVPEPATALLLLGGVAATLRRRR